jgi:hypothetical protein
MTFFVSTKRQEATSNKQQATSNDDKLQVQLVQYPLLTASYLSKI